MNVIVKPKTKEEHSEKIKRIGRQIIKHYLPDMPLKKEKSSESSQSSLQESELSDLIKYLDGDGVGEEDNLNDSLDEKSFTEFDYMNNTKSPLNKKFRQRKREDISQMKYDEVQGKYSELTFKMIKKISPYEIKVTKKDVFPLQVYKS